ncbi:MAG TPA: metal ABC transporter permease [Desulfobacteria bacterium]|nr:metal ABC transporter permease [Desulfobacteria bacterium]
MNLLLDPLRFPFMQHALLGSIFVGAICAALGTFVVLRKIGFIGEGLAHGSLGGLAIGYIFHWNLYLTGNIYTGALALLIGYLHAKAKVSLDTAIGIIFSASLALGVALISRMQSYTTDLTAYLFGSVLSITNQDLQIIVIGASILLLLLVVFYKELVFCAFDPEMAEISGVPGTFFHYLLLLMIGAAVVIASQTLGIILVTAMLVIPAATAYQLTSSLGKMILLAVGVSIFASIVGLFVSYYLNIASGASIALAAAICFLLTYVFSPKRKTLHSSFGLR